MTQESPTLTPPETPPPTEEPQLTPPGAPVETPTPEPAAAPAEQAGGGKSSMPFILALIGGILILVNGILLTIMGTLIASFASMIPGMEMMIGVLTGMAFAAPVFGVIVIVGAILMRNAARAKIGGILVLVFSIIGLFIGGGFLVGSRLGIIGGALALKG